jgi:hypothetical protein
LIAKIARIAKIDDLQVHRCFAVSREAENIAVSSRDSFKRSPILSFFTIPRSDSNSIQKTDSSASSVTIPIFEMNSALERARQAAR